MTLELTTQQKIVLNYLKSGRTLTNLVALALLGVGSLTSRIAELRNLGYEIDDEWDEDHFERRYKKYWIAVLPKDQEG